MTTVLAIPSPRIDATIRCSLTRPWTPSPVPSIIKVALYPEAHAVAKAANASEEGMRELRHRQRHSYNRRGDERLRGLAGEHDRKAGSRFEADICVARAEALATRAVGLNLRRLRVVTGAAYG